MHECREDSQDFQSSVRSNTVHGPRRGWTRCCNIHLQQGSTKSEILADVGHCVTDRTLLTLVPNERVMDNVITVVITMLSKTSSSHHWFMPTMIMIFQPIWTDGHWYLMVVDLRRQKLVYFDSLKCTRETESKKLSMTHVALHLESLTIGPKWLSKSTMERPRFSLFKYEEPFVPQQHRLS
ncbi:uncharacterized protein LOC107634650 isoform X1 [Arachis ipaensis]|uniref:uncharacterized protein LOC107634650 isoform X1 n=1 Tax=Arachis ipaensis TaxID=130454 RepID=UPI0007AF1AC8|nr:uncharacterized protein LOC107634650 isoform X1 [Arachis ipaensis]XP_020975053.1 uncharacterized protein LOC107634650 isoform X1 [Arachis ipaensis]XP_020975054.1 uncharacterized protein LOC107634650 isoform X1 [Arachis ipaensis]XP_025638020.1 uncharacterized protein LOC112733314 isoform X1 [Arachis hypogaea]XP_029147540.1 uncharacterized protein LOC112733314 isoform X1 [Arachis hypogaea]